MWQLGAALVRFVFIFWFCFHFPAYSGSVAAAMVNEVLKMEMLLSTGGEAFPLLAPHRLQSPWDGSRGGLGRELGLVSRAGSCTNKHLGSCVPPRLGTSWVWLELSGLRPFLKHSPAAEKALSIQDEALCFAFLSRGVDVCLLLVYFT